MIISFLLPIAEKTLNRFLGLDPEVKKRLHSLTDKIIAIELSQSKIRIYFIIDGDYIHLSEHSAQSADVVLSGTPFDFLSLGVAKNDSVAVFSSKVTIIGNSEVAQSFKKIFADLEVDWEEQLSHIAGDRVAYQLGSAIRKFSQWAKQTHDTFQQNFTEYVQEEARLLPTQVELQYFFTEVDTLRDDVERIALRIKQIEQNL